MSEQYRCTECGHFVEIQDDAICDVCHIGKMEHLRYIKGGNGSHWEGCEEVHYDCKIAKLEAELARRDEIISRLKEDAERLASGYEQVSREIVPYCVVCKKDAFSGYLGQIKHDDWCPVTIHRALMKELEG